jgi:hypothetical protein
MTIHTPNVDFEEIIREARMERSMAIAGALASGIAAISRGFDRLIALIGHAFHDTLHVQDPRG